MARKTDQSKLSATVLSCEKELMPLGWRMVYSQLCSEVYKVTFRREGGSCDLTLAFPMSQFKTTADTGGDTVPSTLTESGGSETPTTSKQERGSSGSDPVRNESRPSVRSATES